MYFTFILQRVLSNDAQRYLDAVGKQMSSAVMPGFLQLIELETDPQCLLICFDMFQTVVKNIPLGVYVDDMFEYPAGYFPIDFQGVSCKPMCLYSTSYTLFVYPINVRNGDFYKLLRKLHQLFL